jgi:hypothetical protein
MATTTEMANATKPSPSVNSPATTSKPSPSVNSPATHQRSATNQRPATYQRDIPAARRVTVVERATELSDEVLESLEAGQRAAIEAAGRFLVTVEEALPQEVQGTSEVARKITESGLEMADRLVHTQYDFVRKVIDGTAKALSSRNAARPSAAR